MELLTEPGVQEFMPKATESFLERSPSHKLLLAVLSVSPESRKTLIAVMQNGEARMILERTDDRKIPTTAKALADPLVHRPIGSLKSETARQDAMRIVVATPDEHRPAVAQLVKNTQIRELIKGAFNNRDNDFSIGEAATTLLNPATLKSILATSSGFDSGTMLSKVMQAFPDDRPMLAAACAEFGFHFDRDVKPEFLGNALGGAQRGGVDVMAVLKEMKPGEQRAVTNAFSSLDLSPALASGAFKALADPAQRELFMKAAPEAKPAVLASMAVRLGDKQKIAQEWKVSPEWLTKNLESFIREKIVDK